MAYNEYLEDEVIVNVETNDNLSLSTASKEELNGVYCVNQGIADFRYIEIKYQDDEYTIVNDNVPYSISWYDRIILNQALVKENQIIK